MGNDDDWDIVDGVPRLKPGIRLPRVGDVWQCDCDKTWVFTRGGRRGSVYVASNWQPETRRQRRKRLRQLDRH